MTNHITCHEDALELAAEYASLGLPLPVDLEVYLATEHGTVTDMSLLTDQEDDDAVPFLSTHFQQEV